MTELLIRAFIKNSERAGDLAVRSAYGKLAGKVGIICNVLLCAGKFAAGVISGSLSISADAMNNLSDASSGIISLVGFKLSEKTADREHPYGHGRYEYLAGFMVAALVIVIGAELLRDSIIKIVKPADVLFGILPVTVLSVSILVKLWLMLFYKKIAKRINSDTLRASAVDSLSDVFSTAAVLAALVISHFTGINLDGVMGAAVAVIILINGIKLVKDAINPLLGKAPSAEMVEDIRQTIQGYDGVLGMHDLMVHDYGIGRAFASVHVEVRADMPLVECHDIIDRIEREFQKRGLNLTIHPDPVFSETPPALDGIMRGIDERITVHNVRIIGSPTPKEVVFDCVLPQELTLSQAEIKEQVTKQVQESLPDCEVVIQFK